MAGADLSLDIVFFNLMPANGFPTLKRKINKYETSAVFSSLLNHYQRMQSAVWCKDNPALIVCMDIDCDEGVLETPVFLLLGTSAVQMHGQVSAHIHLKEELIRLFQDRNQHFAGMFSFRSEKTSFTRTVFMTLLLLWEKFKTPLPNKIIHTLGWCCGIFTTPSMCTRFF